MNGTKTTIPYDSEAGQRAFEKVLRIAERLWDTAQSATSELIADIAPTAETRSEHYSDGKYYRTIESPDGRRDTLTYDYRTKAVTILNETEARKWTRRRTRKSLNVCAAGAS